MRLRLKVITLLLTFTVMAGCVTPARVAPTSDAPAHTERAASTLNGFVTAQGNRLMLNGVVYRVIGVNIPHLHQAYMGTWFHIAEIYGTPEKARQAMIDAIVDAEQSGIAFIRFFAWPGYPIDVEKLYASNPDEYWRQMDELFALCRQHGIRLIPSLGVLFSWHLVYGETRRAMLDPSSKTYQATRRYVQEFVTRYRDDPVVLLWELENEGFLTADVNMAGRKLPPKGTYPSGSTVYRANATLKDSLSFTMLQQIYTDMTGFIKGLDANHLVTSGDAGVRDTSQSLREAFPGQVWTPDTLDQHLSNLVESQAQPLDVYSVHAYVPMQHQKLTGDLSALEYLRAVVHHLHETESPVFIGELGQIDPPFKDDLDGVWARQAINMMEQEDVSLAALWVWHFPWQPENTFDSTSHPLLVQRIAAFNQKYARQ